jgi:dipeptidyl aminopeptidase/acylaminoacyl peptidase
MTRIIRFNGLVAMCVVVAPLAFAQTPASDTRYLAPPQGIVRILEAPPPPTVVVSPSRDVVAIVERASMPPLEELAQPMLRLAGLRVNPLTWGPHRTPGVTSVTFTPIAGGAERRVTRPGSSSLMPIGFSPDGKSYALAIVARDGISLGIVDPSTGAVKDAGLSLNAVFDSPFGGSACDWTDDSTALVCRAVPEKRGTAPAAPAVPSGPEIQETSGKPAPVRTYQDLLASAHDEALFEHYGTSEIAIVDAKTLAVSRVGQAGLYTAATPSPDGRYLMVTRLVRPFSRLVPYSDFPQHIEIWTRAGQKVQTLAEIPMADAVPMNGVIDAPRDHEWHPTAPATVLWAEALDKGDLKNNVPHRDRVRSLAAPFTGEPAEVTRTAWRFRGMAYTEKGTALVTEFDRPTRKVRVWVHEGTSPARVLFERSSQDRYNDPGMPMRRAGSSAILQTGSAIYMTGLGASPEGDRPFLDRLDLATGKAERLFRSDASSYETVLALLDDGAARIVTRRETRTEPPNAYVRERANGTMTALTRYEDPAPQLAGITKQLLTYERPDGVKLSATLYLPPGHKTGQRYPMIFWAYPREFTDASVAGQVSGSPNRFTSIAGPSHLLLLTQGYAILDDPSMPIVGPGETANDTYVEQLVASAKAAVDKVVELGVADRDRIGVGGHSYGAFMTANLLAHSDLFRAGIARSGAYNRTLTPFGFQAETRTFWEVPQIYAKMSPFWYANKVDEPILLIHGAADNNSGTFPIQSERFYMALKGHGATVRYVVLPHESHGYAARESVLHTVAEMLNWADRHVKNAQPRATATSSSAR